MMDVQENDNVQDPLRRWTKPMQLTISLVHTMYIVYSVVVIYKSYTSVLLI